MPKIEQLKETEFKDIPKYAAAVAASAAGSALVRYHEGYRELTLLEENAWRCVLNRPDHSHSIDTALGYLIAGQASEFALQRLSKAVSQFKGISPSDEYGKIKNRCIKEAAEFGPFMEKFVMEEASRFINKNEYWHAILAIAKVLYETGRVTDDTPEVTAFRKLDEYAKEFCPSIDAEDRQSLTCGKIRASKASKD
jgi:hypothetical protein